MLIAAACAPGVAAALAQTSCDGIDVTIETEDADLAGRLCALAETSAASLAECNLAVPHPLQIEVKQSLDWNCLGLFHCGTSRIELLDPASFARAVEDEGPFAGIPIAHHYDSVLVHELAHAAYDDRNCPLATCPVNQEFIAYAMQVRSLSHADRVQFEASSPIEPSEARRYLNAGMLAMAPDRFAFAAWWHFSRQEDPCAYVGAIAAGDVLLDRSN